MSHVPLAMATPEVSPSTLNEDIVRPMTRRETPYVSQNPIRTSDTHPLQGISTKQLKF
jgi:hypothetical protein